MDFPLPFQVDRIIAEQHGGTAVEENLAFACPHCNRYKGPNVAGVDPDTSEVTRLFHPRRDLWAEHFRFNGALIGGKTPVGRSTVRVLAMNSRDLLAIRTELLVERKSLGT
jgi:hypothetical protein